MAWQARSRVSLMRARSNSKCLPVLAGDSPDVQGDIMSSPTARSKEGGTRTRALWRDLRADQGRVRNTGSSERAAGVAGKNEGRCEDEHGGGVF